jgi:hypothetical protein
MDLTRKQFLNNWMRYLLMAIIAVISGVALFKGRHADADNCPPGNVCQGCGKAKQCSLPVKSIKT